MPIQWPLARTFASVASASASGVGQASFGVSVVALMHAPFTKNVATIGFGLSEHVAVAFACLFFTGVFDEVSVLIRTTLAQIIRDVVDDQRARLART